MLVVALAIGLSLAAPAFAADCSGAVPNDGCAADSPALTSSSGAPTGASGVRSKTSPRSSKVHSAIAAMVTAIEARKTSSAAGDMGTLSTKLVRVNDAGEIQVYVILTELTPERVARLESLGLRVEVTLPTQRLVQGWLPSAAVQAVAALDFVERVKPPSYGFRSGAGAVDTEGDALIGAAPARTAFSVSGAGVKVGVISDGVDQMGFSVASGDLPAGIQIVQPGSGNEGTALLEIVHDIAPGASLAFAGPQTSAEMVAAIAGLSALGSRVIVDDVAFFGEPKFEDGPVAQTVRAFAQSGNVYVSSAGNQALAHYRAPYNQVAGKNFPSKDYPGVHNYASGAVDIGNTLVVPPGCSLTAILQWNNRFGASADDFDLFIARASDSAILGGGIDEQTGTGDPLEGAVFANLSHAPVMVFIAVAEFQLVSPPAALVLDYFALLDCSSVAGLKYNTPAESLSGNHNLIEAMPIAANSALTPGVAEVYSSQGPATISFPVPEVRSVPVLTSIDCVSTQTGKLGYFAFPFCGTSASAPHVAGIVALLIEKAPTLSSDQLRSVLMGTAVDLGAPGFDFTYGFGLADAYGALNFVSSGPHVALALGANRATVAAGDPFSLSVVEANTGTATAQDVYFGALVPLGLSTSLGCPAGDGLLLFADGFTRTVVVCYNSSPPQTFAALYPAHAIAAALPPTALANLSLPWPADVPAGTYTFVTFATPPGAFADGAIGPNDITVVAVATVQAGP